MRKNVSASQPGANIESAWGQRGCGKMLGCLELEKEHLYTLDIPPTVTYLHSSGQEHPSRLGCLSGELALVAKCREIIQVNGPDHGTSKLVLWPLSLFKDRGHQESFYFLRPGLS